MTATTGSSCIQQKISFSFKLAEEEERIKEGEENMDKYLEEFRTVVLGMKGLICPTDDAFLIRFLRARKYKIQEAENLIHNYYEMKRNNKDVSSISFADLKTVYDEKILIALKHRDFMGRKIIYFRTGLWDPAICTYGELLMSGFYMMEEITQSVDSQKNGIVVILDNGDSTFQKTRRVISQLPFGKIGQLVPFFQGSFPAHFKAFHIVNANLIFDLIFRSVRFFLKEKLQNRIHVHKNGFDTLHHAICPEILPTRLGGELSMEEAEDTKILTSMYDREDYYLNMLRYGYDERERN